ncbi:GNAT family acetyltransferase [Shinella sp. CPCC 101442]|uniref:GNAT family acetyltransferase n=1 Tax=Shinella sp. CPCC 101442 TaxID=2932265 RepID=UPI00215201AA|nr:GNAT family acetyltransferase [Shinella sp. CPCC 101442]MCR6500176.1 GNAT family acetyltransferase [Shinella sp. CPCC 101442]
MATSVEVHITIHGASRQRYSPAHSNSQDVAACEPDRHPGKGHGNLLQAAGLMLHFAGSFNGIRSAMAFITTYHSAHFSGVEALWAEAFPNDAPWNATAPSIAEKLRFQPDLMLVALDGTQVVGSVMAGYEGHRGWISRIAVLRSHRSRGVGQDLLAEAERRLASLGCVKVNLQVVESNAQTVEFYERSGYRIEPRISMSKHLRS